MADNLSAGFYDRLTAMKAKFGLQLPERVATVRALCNTVLEGQHDEQELARLRVLIHNLAGSGATFGYAEVTAVARELELIFKRSSEFGVDWLRSQNNEIRVLLADLDNAVDVLSEQPQSSLRELANDDTAHQTSKRIYVLEDDQDFAAHLDVLLRRQGYEMKLFSGPEGLREAVVNAPPLAILVDMGLPAGALAGAEIVSELRAAIAEPVPTIFVTVRDDFEARLEAVRAGSSHYLTKPLDVDALFAILDTVAFTSPADPYRILLVDDDTTLASFYEEHLTSARMVVKTVHDPREAAELLEWYAAELIILDVNLPHCTGLELAAVIRQQERFAGVPVVFLSAEADIDRRLAAMHLGGDDFLTKPVEPWRLLRCTYARVKRARDLREEMDRRKRAEVSAQHAYEVLERRVQERTAMLAHQATHDSLTGLVNRYEFERRLRRVLSSSADATGHALLYLDLDQFKIVNDTCGHSAGDEMLRQASVRLSSCIRLRDTLARLGGDEFAVLLERCPLEEAMRVANTIRCTTQDNRFAWKDQSFSVTVSIGLVPLTPPYQTIEAAMSAADSACYTAKECGRNRIQVYQLDDTARAQRHGEMQWVPRLQRALADNSLALYFQSIFPIGTTEPDREHGEVLLRLADSAGPIVPPGAFLPAAERYDQIRSLDCWVVRNAMAALQKRLAAQPTARPLYSINVSGQSLGDPEFLKFVHQNLLEFAIPGETLCFEITETAAVSDLKHATQFMSTLREFGCSFALDDFGRGLSSFGYLKTLPVDYLKIDGTFIKDLATDHVDVAMVQAIHEIGKVMGLKTIAEWVESEAIYEKLADLGIDYAQGFWLHQPSSMN